jgi:hypothetical protein
VRALQAAEDFKREDDDLVVLHPAAPLPGLLEPVRPQPGTDEALGTREPFRSHSLDGRGRGRGRGGRQDDGGRLVGSHPREHLDEVAQRGPLVGPVAGP